MTQEQKDAADVATYRAWCAEFDAISEVDWSFANDQRLDELRDLIDDGSDKFTDAALRTIDRLTAAYDALRAACEGVPEMMYYFADDIEAHSRLDEYVAGYEEQVRAKAAQLRAALAGRAAAPDADRAADADGGAEG